MNEVGFTVSQCIDFVKNIQQQANDVVEIRTLMTSDKYNIFTTALKRIGNALIMLSNVFTSNNNVENDHNKLFEFNNLKLSQIETIGVKLAPIQELFDLLAELYFYNSQFCVRFRVKLRALCKLYIRFKKPSTLKRRLYKHFKDIEELLPLVIDLKRTIFGSAQRIRHPIMRKAWMLAGENQLNDSSLPSNILQDNLYMLLDSEIGEDVINKWEIKDRFKNGIAYIVDDIDNRGTTKGDNNISIAELNDLPQVMFDYLPKDQDNVFNIDFDNEDSSQDNISTNKPTNHKNNGGSRYLCMLNQHIYSNDTDTDNEADDDDNNITTNKNTNILKEYEYNCTQHFFDVYTNYLQGTWFAKKKAILQEKLELLQAKQDKKYAEQNNPDNIAEYTKKVDKLQTKLVMQEQNDIETKIKGFDNMQTILPPLYSDLIILPLLLEYKKGSPQLTAGVKRSDNKDLDNTVDSPKKTKGYINNFMHSSQNDMYHPPCVSDYGHEYPCIQIAQEEVVFGKYMETNIDKNKYQLTNICFTIVAHDQNQGGTGKVHIRYQINKGKCIKAFTIIRQRKKQKNGKHNNTPPDTYKFNINRHEIFKNRKNMTDNDNQTITVWMFCPDESGWSATVKSINWEHKYSYIGN